MAQKVFGDFSVVAGVTSAYGTGLINVADQILLTGSTGSKRIRTTGTAMPLSLEATGGVNITGATASTWQTSAGAVSIIGNAGVNLTATTSDIVLTNTATSGNVTLNAGTASGTLGLYGKTVTIGNATTTQINLGTATATPITIGTSTSTTTVAGNLTVSGTTTTVNTTTLDVTDNLIVVNSAPATTGRDGGILFKRHTGDVVADTVSYTTALNANASSSATTIAITNSAVDFTGYVVRLNDGVNAENHVVVSSNYPTSPQVLTLDVGLTNGFLTATPTVVTLYGGTFASMFYNEASDEFKIAYTHSLETASTAVADRYANIHTNNITAEGTITAVGGFSANGFNLLTETLGADMGSGSATTIGTAVSKTRGTYIFMVESVVTTGASAIFVMTKASATDVGSVFRLSSVPGTNLEEIDCQWLASAKPSFFHNPLRQTGTLNAVLTYTIRLLSTS